MHYTVWGPHRARISLAGTSLRLTVGWKSATCQEGFFHFRCQQTASLHLKTHLYTLQSSQCCRLVVMRLKVKVDRSCSVRVVHTVAVHPCCGEAVAEHQGFTWNVCTLSARWCVTISLWDIYTATKHCLIQNVAVVPQSHNQFHLRCFEITPGYEL